MAAMPPAIRVPYKFFESVTMRSALQMSRAYRDSTNAAPTNPKRSPITAKMKSVCRSGRKSSFVWVASSPRPVFSPEPMAIRALVDLIARVAGVVARMQECGQPVLLVALRGPGSADGRSDHEDEATSARPPPPITAKCAPRYPGDEQHGEGDDAVARVPCRGPAAGRRAPPGPGRARACGASGACRSRRAGCASITNAGERDDQQQLAELRGLEA